jgi:hypothetical protein
VKKMLFSVSVVVVKRSEILRLSIFLCDLRPLRTSLATVIAFIPLNLHVVHTCNSILSPNHAYYSA